MSKFFGAHAIACLAVFLSCDASAQATPSFALPIACEIGKACVLQSYVDRDPGPGARDYRCGHLTYDGHKGTDIRVIDLAAFKRGVPVLAAAPGRVRAIRDAMQDVSVRAVGKAALQGKDAGNSVVIEHGEGWETQYAHLRQGSVSVRAGDAVRRGQQIGLVGLSGNTEFPHLHFEVRDRGKTVDPFVGADPGEPCQPGRSALWQPEVLTTLSYVETGVLGAGIAGALPEQHNASVDPGRIAKLASASGAAVFWVHIYGAQAGDIEELRLIAPDGSVLAKRRTRVKRNLAQSLAYIGSRRRAASWPPGSYRGEYFLFRGAQEKEPRISLTRDHSIAPADRN